MQKQLYNPATFLSLILITILFCSCAPRRNLVYFSDMNPDGSQTTKQDFTALEPKILPNDLLAIVVSTLSTASNSLFNVPATSNGQTPAGYLVDKNGFINFPGLKPVKLRDLTLNEAKIKLTTLLSDLTKDPNVTVSFLNFRVTVIGEVTRPGTFNVVNNEITLLEALGLAGDMTAFGRRDNVRIIRQKDGTREVGYLNMNSGAILGSNYYYLMQNDVVYVEPAKSKEQSVNQNNRYIPIISASFSVLAVLVSVFVRR